MKPFELEERYIVVKLKHLDGATKDYLRMILKNSAIPTVDCIVVEQDWPEYEMVWKSMEGRL